MTFVLNSYGPGNSGKFYVCGGVVRGRVKRIDLTWWLGFALMTFPVGFYGEGQGRCPLEHKPRVHRRSRIPE